MIITGIDWEDDNKELPTEVDVTKLVEDWDMDMDDIADWLSETYQTNVVGFSIEEE